MTLSSEFEHLTATWPEHPGGTACAAVAEGFRKRGELSEATLVATQCLERWPEFLPGHLVFARIRRDSGEPAEAERALFGALALDPAHPLVLRELASLAALRGASADSRAWQQLGDAAVEPPASEPIAFLAGPAFQREEPAAFLAESSLDGEPDEPGEEVLTESLAALFRAQGHLERAAEVYAVLADRAPDNAMLAQRRDELRDDLARQSPRSYDARVSGGIATGPWLRGLASARPQSGRRKDTGYDAFYRAPSSHEPPEDFEAFQTWLKGLGR